MKHNKTRFSSKSKVIVVTAVTTMLACFWLANLDGFKEAIIWQTLSTNEVYLPVLNIGWWMLLLGAFIGTLSERRRRKNLDIVEKKKDDS